MSSVPTTTGTPAAAAAATPSVTTAKSSTTTSVIIHKPCYIAILAALATNWALSGRFPALALPWYLRVVLSTGVLCGLHVGIGVALGNPNAGVLFGIDTVVTTTSSAPAPGTA